MRTEHALEHSGQPGRRGRSEVGSEHPFDQGSMDGGAVCVMLHEKIVRSAAPAATFSFVHNVEMNL